MYYFKMNPRILFTYSAKDLEYFCLHLRPHELGNLLYSVKVLKKYNRLLNTENFESAFSKIFKNTPYQFSWNINYKNTNSYSYSHYEKKVLYNFNYNL